jgi:hypothetical protein
VIWEPFILALVLGLIVSAGLYFAYLWPAVEPVDDEPAAEIPESPAASPSLAAADNGTAATNAVATNDTATTDGTATTDAAAATGVAENPAP